MTSIKAAILATVQRVREYYQIVGTTQQKAIAIPPEWINSAPLVLHLQDRSQWTEAEKLQNEYELSRFVNAIVNHPHVWDNEGDVLWKVLGQLLDANNTEITQDVLDAWVENRYLLEEHYVKTQLQDIDFQVTYLDPNPTWRKIEITAEQFADLYERAVQDEEFSQTYEIIQGGDLDDLLDIKKISFEMASVNVDRPWLKEELLESRHWRLRPGATINGKTFLSSSEREKAFQGALPGYPSAFILVRHLEVAFGVASDEQQEVLEQYLETGKTLNFGPLLLNGHFKKFLGGRQLQVQGLSASLQSQIQLKKNLQINRIRNPSSLKAPTSRIGDKIRIIPNNPIGNSTLNARGRMKQPFRTGLGGKMKFKTTTLTRKLPLVVLADVSVSVTDRQKRPMPEAELAFSQVGNEDQENSYLVHTDNSGQVDLKLVTNRQYQVLITKPGYKSFKTTISTHSGKTVAINAKLEAKAGVDVTEKVSDIQLLAVVYHKLGQSPNPSDHFEAFTESLF